MELLESLLAFSLLILACHCQNSCKGPDFTPVNDIFNLDDWQRNPRSFGNAVLGYLASNPDERRTVQSLMNMTKLSSKSNDTFDLTQQMLKGYFYMLPDILKSQGQGVGVLYANDTENQLNGHVEDNFANHTARNEKYYFRMTNLERSQFLMQRYNWQQVFLVKRTYLLMLKYLISLPYEKYRPVGVNEQCYTDVVHTIRSFYINKPWALEMLDATGKPPIGLFQGNLNWIGQYDQCYRIQADRSNIATQETIEKNVFQGSYCDIQMDVKKALPFIDIPAAPGQKLYLKIGLCFPNTCNSKDVNDIMQNLQIVGNKFPEIEKTRCHNESPMESGEFSTDTLAHVASGVLGIFVVFTVLATLMEGLFWYKTEDQVEEENKKRSEAFATPHIKIELTDASMSNVNGNVNGGFHPSDGIEKQAIPANGTSDYETVDKAIEPAAPKKDGFFKQLVKTFSLYTNVPALLSTHQSKSAIKSLDALRVFNMNWIVLGHVYSIGAIFIPETMSNAKIAVEKIKDPTYMGVFSAMLAVDSFFFISGLLVSYLFLKTSKKDNSSATWIKQMVLYYFHRFVRILPLYGVLILVYAAFGKYLGAGPLFDWQSQRVRDCNTNWWANILFINNFVNPREMCLGWSWYLSNDMQFYVVAPLMLIPLFIMPIVGMIIIAVFMLAHWGATAYLWAQTEGKSYLQDPDIFYEAYLTPYCRIGPYLVGIVLGFIFYKKIKLPTFMRSFIVAVCWALTLLILGVVIYVQYEDTRINGVSEPTWGTLQRTAYETLSRDAWALALAWIVYACNHGYGGFVAHIVNWRGWAPLSRMTFAVYLIHPLVIFIYVGNRRDLHYVDDFSVSFMYCGYLLLSYVAGAILSLIFEWPPASLDKLILGNARRPKAKDNKADVTQIDYPASTKL